MWHDHVRSSHTSQIKFIILSFLKTSSVLYIICMTPVYEISNMPLTPVCALMCVIFDTFLAKEIQSIPKEMLINNANQQAASLMLSHQWQFWLKLKLKYVFTGLYFHFFFLKGTRTRYTTSLSYLKRGAIYLTPCDYLNDLGSIEIFWTNSIVYCNLFNSCCKAQREMAEQGVGSLKIATCQRELERKRLAELHHHSAGRFFSVLLSHSLLMFLFAFQSGGCRDILPLGQHYKELPKSGLAGCPPAIGRLFTHSWRMVVFLPEAVQSESAQRWAQLRIVTDTSTQLHTRENLHICI